MSPQANVEWNALKDLVLGDPVECSCGSDVGHHYAIENGWFYGVVIQGTGTPVTHRILVRGDEMFVLGNSGTGFSAWHAPTGAAIKL